MYSSYFTHRSIPSGHRDLSMKSHAPSSMAENAAIVRISARISPHGLLDFTSAISQFGLILCPIAGTAMTRFHELDALRAAAMLLGFVLHVSMFLVRQSSPRRYPLTCSTTTSCSPFTASGCRSFIASDILGSVRRLAATEHVRPTTWLYIFERIQPSDPLKLGETRRRRYG